MAEAEGLIAAMELARSFVPNSQFVARLAQALYSDVSYEPAPNSAHHAIVDLAHAWGDVYGAPAAILTTNFDVLLQCAADEAKIAAQTFVHKTSPEPDFQWFAGEAGLGGGIADDGSGCQRILGEQGLPIVHLHGAIPPDGGLRGILIASEYDYFGEQGATLTSAQQSLFEEARRGLTIFVGTALADPRLIRLILQSAGTGLATAVFSEQSLSWIRSPDDPPMDVVRAWLHTYEAKWNRAGVGLVWTDYFSQITQLVHEINPRRGQSVDPPRPSYGKRLDDWAERFEKHPAGMATVEISVVPSDVGEPEDQDRAEAAGGAGDGAPQGPAEPSAVEMVAFHDWARSASAEEAFAVKQTIYREALAEGVAELGDLVVERCPGVESSGERFKLDLWVRSPRSRSLVRFASSDAEFPAEESLLAASIPLTDSYGVVRAFRSGTTEVVEEGTGRWKTIVCEPVAIGDPTDADLERPFTYGTLPVGVMVLASTSGLNESVLADPAMDFGTVRASLAAMGRALLDA